MTLITEDGVALLNEDGSLAVSVESTILPDDPDPPEEATTIEMPAGEYFLIVDTGDESALGIQDEIARNGYAATQKRLDSVVEDQAPAGVIVKLFGENPLGGGSPRLDGLTRARDHGFPAVWEDVSSWGVWGLDPDFPTPRNRNGGTLPLWFWLGGFPQALLSELGNSPRSKYIDLSEELRLYLDTGIDGVIINRASNLDESTFPADLLRERIDLEQQLAPTGWPLSIARQWIGQPVVLEWSQRTEHPSWPGGTADGKLSVAEVGTVLIVLDPGSPTLAADAAAAIAVGASIGVPEALWTDDMVVFPTQVPDTDLNTDPHTLTVYVGEEPIAVTALSSLAEIQRLYSQAGYENIQDDLSASDQSTLIDDVIAEASDMIYSFLSPAAFTTESISGNRMVRRAATYGAAFFLSQRRGNPGIDSFGDAWERSLEFLREVANNPSVRIPDLVEEEQVGLHYIGLQNQAGPFPYGEPVRLDREASTNSFRGARPIRRTYGAYWGRS